MTDSADDRASLAAPADERVGLGTIVREWGRIGVTGFGGPPAHIALLRKLCVDRRGWLTPREFEDGVATVNLLPGPASTQLAIYCAWRLRGRTGALVGGVCFIVPGLIIILALSALFFASRPPRWVEGAAAGAGAAVPAVAVQAAVGLMPASWRQTGDQRARQARWLCYLVAGGAAAATVGPYLVLVLLACGLIEITARPGGWAGVAQRPLALSPLALSPLAQRPLALSRLARSPLALSRLALSRLALSRLALSRLARSPLALSRLARSPLALSSVVAGPALAGGLAAVAWVAFKVGALSYGGGFVIIPLMQHDAVTTYHWMTGAQFLNAVALGQVTPGPVVLTVAAVGYAAGGVGAALLATLVAFTPSFLFVLVGAPHFGRLRSSTRIQMFLTGAGAAAIGAIAGAAIPLGLALGHVWQFGLLALAAAWLIGLRKSVVAALIGCAALGVIAALAGFPVPR